MLDLRIGGVPEHFNYPWYLTLKNKEYTQQGINLRWKDFPGGTGDMCKALRSGDFLEVATHFIPESFKTSRKPDFIKLVSRS